MQRDVMMSFDKQTWRLTPVYTKRWAYDDFSSAINLSRDAKQM